MTSIHIDIQTRVLPADHRAFVVRPGANYRLYSEVVENSAILYDMPGLELADNVSFSETPELASQLLRSQEIRRWWRVGRHHGEAYPSLALQDYPPPVGIVERRSLTQITSIGASYFERARPGDLVIVPPQRFADPVMVGEIVVGDIIRTTVADYGDEPMYGRKVRWLAEIPKDQIPSRVVGISQKPNSFALLERSIATWFYDRSYKSYVLAGRYQSELKVLAEKFGSTDDLKLTAFLNFVAANLKSLETHGGLAVPLKDAAFANLAEYEPDKRISINSPGEIIVHAAKLTPILFVVLLALSGCAPAEVSAALGSNTITIGNTSAGPGDPCAAEVYQSTIEWLTLVGADMWEKACPIAAQALNSAEISLPAVIQVIP